MGFKSEKVQNWNKRKGIYYVRYMKARKIDTVREGKEQTKKLYGQPNITSLKRKLVKTYLPGAHTHICKKLKVVNAKEEDQKISVQ